MWSAISMTLCAYVLTVAQAAQVPLTPEETTLPETAANETGAIPTVDVPTQSEAIPEGETKSLQALVMEVKGKARWRASSESPWKDAAVNDVLDSGAEIRTAMRSSVALRVGKNASVFVDSGTNFVIPEIVQDGATLRTRAAVKAGRAEFKVDEVGLANDFQVITPSSTLAVRGTTFSVDWGGLNGLEVLGSTSNRLNAIEMRYFLSNLQFFVSGDGKSSESSPEPAQAAWLDTVGGSTLMGQVASSSEFQQLLETGFAILSGYTDQKSLQNAFNSIQSTFAKAGGIGVPTPPDDPGDPGGPLTDVQKFQILCDNFNSFINNFRGDLEASLTKIDYSFSQQNLVAYSNMVNQLSNLCFFYDPKTTPDPLQTFIGYMQSYCNNLDTPAAVDICLTVVDQTIGFTLIKKGGGS